MSRSMKESEKAIKAFSSRVMRRLLQAGDRSLSREDIEQECWIAWTIASERYDETCGVPFLAYLRRGMQQHVNRIVRRNVDDRHDEVMAISLDATYGDDSDATLSEVIADTDASADRAADEQMMFEVAIARLNNPMSRKFLEILYHQPPAVIDQVRQVRARAKYASKLGIHSFAPTTLTANLIFNIMGVSRAERTVILKDMRSLGAIMSEV